jgi:hypothetical protein
MASTRNINTKANYRQEQDQYKFSQIYTLYHNSQYGYAYDTKYAGNGLNPGAIRNDKLSKNAVDIESFLYGINTTDLTKETPDILYPQLNCLESQNIFDKSPIYMPQPLVVEKNQRPFPAP